MTRDIKWNETRHTAIIWSLNQTRIIVDSTSQHCGRITAKLVRQEAGLSKWPSSFIGQVDLLLYQLLYIVALLELNLPQTILLGPWTLTCPDHVHSKWCFTRRRCKHVLFHMLIVMPSILSDNDTDNTVRVFVVIFCIVMHDYCVIHSILSLVSWCMSPK